MSTLFILTLVLPQALRAAELLESYQAYLSRNDHYNSRGERLRSAAAIIRQDRANFHRFGLRDDGDDWDSFFENKTNRARLEQMLNEGRAASHVLNEIINSDPVIIVNIYGHGATGTYVEVLLK
ncbi:MAG: hypothetical protein K8F25_07385 [Fimbriimonadaceae bacterium]|nr:hypothetical protein [Alphaproteobacteria bacterium]